MQTHTLLSLCGGFALAGAFCPALAARADFDLDWVQRYNGSSNYDDRGYDVAADAAGNVYVVGHEFEEINGVGGTLFSPAILVLKYDTEGSLAWSERYRIGVSGACTGYHIAVAPDGNIVVAGAVNGNDDWVALKYDPDGALLWDTVYEANSIFLTDPEDMVLDAAGNIYMTGDVGGTINPDFGAVWKLNSAGVTQWLTEYYGPTFDGASTNALVLDSGGNVYIVGSTSVSGLGSQAAIAKLDPAGDVQWQRTFGYPGASTHDVFWDVDVTSDDRIIAAGNFGLNSADGIDAAIYAFDSAGDTLWAQNFGDLGLAHDETAYYLAIDQNDDIFTAGTDEIGSGDHDVLILKYSTSGAFLWGQTFGGLGLDPDSPSALEVGSDGDVYAAGTYRPFAGVSFYFVARFAGSDGALVAQEEYGGPKDGGSRASSLFVGADDSVVITGASYNGDNFGGGTEDDVATLRFTQPSSAQPAPMIDYGFTFGTHLSGGMAELESSDDLYLSGRSQFGFSAAEPNIIELMTGFNSPTPSPASIAFAMESRLNNPGGNATVRIKNWKDRVYEQVGTFATSQDDSVHTISGIDPSMRVRASDSRIEFSTRVSVIATFSASGFDAWFDQVMTEVQ